ncbi:MAG: proteasome accessory factor PafA2 family protein, partial [Nitrospirales bacterium]
EADIQAARRNGPLDTRGGLRGLCIQRFRDQIAAVQWERIHFRGWVNPPVLDLGTLFDPDEVRACRKALESAGSPKEALQAWDDRKERES